MTDDDTGRAGILGFSYFPPIRIFLKTNGGPIGNSPAGIAAVIYYRVVPCSFPRSVLHNSNWFAPRKYAHCILTASSFPKICFLYLFQVLCAKKFPTLSPSDFPKDIPILNPSSFPRIASCTSYKWVTTIYCCISRTNRFWMPPGLAFFRYVQIHGRETFSS